MSFRDKYTTTPRIHYASTHVKPYALLYVLTYKLDDPSYSSKRQALQQVYARAPANQVLGEWAMDHARREVPAMSIAAWQEARRLCTTEEEMALLFERKRS